jgi:hypothetical protein
MRFDFFQRLPQRDARAFLQRFLDVESSDIKQTLNQCAAEGIKADYSIKSISSFMKWVLKELRTVPLKPDPAMAEWIRNTGSYAKNLFEFDEPSRKFVMQAAYYLGESFVRSSSTLHWGTGSMNTAEGNMPVVTGFKRGFELAPILIANNLLRRVAAAPKKNGDLEKAVEYWAEKV